MTQRSAAALARTLEVRALIERAGGIRPAARLLGLSAQRVGQIARRPGAPEWHLPPKQPKAPHLPGGKKRCPRCLLVKDSSQFYRRGKAGLSSRCRQCNRERVANWKRAQARRQRR
jgi:hypothetical protein